MRLDFNFNILQLQHLLRFDITPCTSLNICIYIWRRWYLLQYIWGSWKIRLTTLAPSMVSVNVCIPRRYGITKKNKLPALLQLLTLCSFTSHEA